MATTSFFHGDLRDLALEPEPEGSPLRLVSLDARWSRWIHFFHYHRRPLRQIIRQNEFDLVHAWHEPYILRRLPNCQSMAGLPIPFTFYTCQKLVKHYRPRSAPSNTRPSPGHKDRSPLGGLSTMRCGGGAIPLSGRILALAVDTAVFQPLDESRRASVRGGLGLRPPLIGYTGRLTGTRGCTSS